MEQAAHGPHQVRAGWQSHCVSLAWAGGVGEGGQGLSRTDAEARAWVRVCKHRPDMIGHGFVYQGSCGVGGWVGWGVVGGWVGGWVGSGGVGVGCGVGGSGWG